MFNSHRKKTYQAVTKPTTPSQKPFKLKKNQQDFLKTYQVPLNLNTHPRNLFARQTKQYDATKPIKNRPKPTKPEKRKNKQKKQKIMPKSLRLISSY